MANLELPELDSLEILVIVDNELDPISPSPNAAVEQSGGMKTVGINGPDISKDPSRGGAARELRMDHICCSAHGLSLLITGVKGSERHTVLFDTGPEEQAFERNATRLKADLGSVETIQLSHWHRDHSGGMLKAVSMIQAAKPTGSEAVHVDLHPARPTYRGIQAPGLPIVSLEADPEFEEIEHAGGVVEKWDQPHTAAGGMFVVSGEIPRVTEYERGLLFGMRYEKEKGKWEQDEKMADERFLMCRLKGML
jgi:7,8-dihydropterin-6-yl-methyl-4-(beta-D-ribofuranosyl)aminobenzene 5'-phosphate synthase